MDNRISTASPYSSILTNLMAAEMAQTNGRQPAVVDRDGDRPEGLRHRRRDADRLQATTTQVTGYLNNTQNVAAKLVDPGQRAERGGRRRRQRPAGDHPGDRLRQRHDADAVAAGRPFRAPSQGLNTQLQRRVHVRRRPGEHPAGQRHDARPTSPPARRSRACSTTTSGSAPTQLDQNTSDHHRFPGRATSARRCSRRCSHRGLQPGPQRSAHRPRSPRPRRAS